MYVKINFYNELFNLDDSSTERTFLKSSYYMCTSFDKYQEETVVSYCCVTVSRISLSVINMNDYITINISFLNFFNPVDDETLRLEVPYLNKLETWFSDSFIQITKDDFERNTNFITCPVEGVFLTFSEDDQTSEHIFNLLQRNEIEYQIITHERHTYSAGASAIGEKIILWIAEKLGDRVFDEIMSKLMEGSINKSKGFNIDIVLEEVSRISKENKNSLYVDSIKQIDEGNYQIILKTQYTSYHVIFNNSHEIIEFKADNKTISRI